MAERSEKPASAPDNRAPPSSAELLAAALTYAARGWPVFPCNPKNKQPLLGADKDADNKPIRGTGGLKKASTDPEQISAWWKRFPNALIGLCPGHPTKGTETAEQPAGLPLLCLDFDPRTDPETGEVWTLARLKQETEGQIGCKLPDSLAVLTPSDGVHLYLLVPDGGAPIGNRGNLPDHVDVRGLGGYVIAPPSVLSDGRRYRLHRKEPIGGIAKAPARLLEVLRSSRSAAPAARPTQPSRASSGPAPDDAVRKYALAALDGELQAVRRAPSGRRNPQLNESALKIASLVAAGALEASLARSLLEQAAHDNPGRDDDRQLSATIDSGWSAGLANPRGLSEIASAARERSDRRGSRSSSRPPSGRSTGRQSSHSGGTGFQPEERGRGGEEPSTADLTRRCAFHPLTDLGNLERFLDRFGRDFLYVEAWGWLAWDQRRWNRDMALPLLAKAAQATVRAIQEEADFIRSSGVPFPDPLGDVDLDDGEDAAVHPRELDLETKRRKAKSAAWYRQRHVARQVPEHGGERLDSIVQVKSNGEIVLYSDKLAAWGRTSESSGHIACLGKPDMAGARVAAMPIEFDANPLLLNVLNGTLAFLRPEPERGFDAAWGIREHRREDRITKICGVEHDPRAACPKFDAFLAKVQPDDDMRAFLDIWSGYNSLGLADAQKFAIFYGEGSNGKGVWINTIAHILGDYAWATGIETFIDQGRYRKGSDASPDLAALAGRRMVYANEAEENSKFSDGLIKELTSDEPKGGVRELMKPPFELQITFTNTVSTNTLPTIGTDHGIQRRVQVVPWTTVIADEEQDLRLKDKLREEASGILNRVVAGAVAYLATGLPTPEAVKAATREYQQDNDLLGKFIQLVVARVPGEVVGARPLHRVFAAWQTWAGQLPASGKPWSEKHLNKQLRKKRFEVAKSSNMKWQDIALRFDANDFCEHSPEGAILRPVESDLPPPRSFAGEIGGDGKPIEDVAPAPPDLPADRGEVDDVTW
jgi:putative DNA primase/helicase